MKLFSGPVPFAEAAGEQPDPPFDLLQNSLINGGVFAIGICNLPVLDARGVIKDEFPAFAGQVDDEVRIFDGLRAKGLGGKIIDRIAVGQEHFLGAERDAAERIEALPMQTKRTRKREGGSMR